MNDNKFDDMIEGKTVKEAIFVEPDEYDNSDKYNTREKPVREESSNIILKLWDKTIFSEKLKNYKAEQEVKRKIKSQAKIEALNEMKDELKKIYKQKELDKLTGNKSGDSNFFKKLASGFEIPNNNDWSSKLFTSREQVKPVRKQSEHSNKKRSKKKQSRRRHEYEQKPESESERIIRLMR